MGIEKDKLFNVIKQNLPENVLFTEEIADALDLSYDASYRRIKGKTSLTFEEAIKLAKHYKISLNELYDLPATNSLLINRKNYKNSIDGLIAFYRELSVYAQSFTPTNKSELFYSAKDIPFYHVKTDDLYWRFRLYVYLNFSEIGHQREKIAFHKFFPKLSAIEEANKFRSIFEQINITDIWSDTTINTSLYQIFYFYRTKLLAKEEALLLCNEIGTIIKNIEHHATLARKQSKKVHFRLYHSKLLNLNHAIFLKNDHRMGLLMPYNSFSHIKIEDSNICKEVEEQLQKQLQLAKKIAADTEVDRKLFFTAMHDKVEQLKREISSKLLISFF
jgi:plasmid maintenance system antidote protein VapI